VFGGHLEVAITQSENEIARLVKATESKRIASKTVETETNLGWILRSLPLIDEKPNGAVLHVTPAKAASQHEGGKQ
jgi:hypothetical protein